MAFNTWNFLAQGVDEHRDMDIFPIQSLAIRFTLRVREVLSRILPVVRIQLKQMTNASCTAGFWILQHSAGGVFIENLKGSYVIQFHIKF
jgi:hypothetical protein